MKYVYVTLPRNNATLQVLPDVRESLRGNGGKRRDDQGPRGLHPWLGKVSKHFVKRVYVLTFF